MPGSGWLWRDIYDYPNNPVLREMMCELTIDPEDYEPPCTIADRLGLLYPTELEVDA